MNDVHLSDERGRLAALSALALVDTGPEPEYEHITELAKVVFDAPVAAVTLISSDRQWFKSVQGLDIAECAREDSFCTVTIRRPEPMVVEDARSHPEFRGNALVVGSPNIRSYAGIPLALPSGHQVGALCVIDFRPRRFTEKQLSTLRNLARCVEKELALRLKATIDGLTGCLCRQTFFDRAERVLSRVRAGRCEAALALLDLDHFKRINDTWGHDAGDAVLTATADALRHAFSGIGEVGRIGGEEFAVLFPDTSLEDARALVERARERIAELVFPAIPGLSVTTSAGLTPLRAADQDPVSAFKRADVALYRAKRNGRNRVELATHDADIAPPPSEAVADLVEARLRDVEASAHGRKRIGRN